MPPEGAAPRRAVRVGGMPGDAPRAPWLGVPPGGRARPALPQELLPGPQAVRDPPRPAREVTLTTALTNIARARYQGRGLADKHRSPGGVARRGLISYPREARAATGSWPWRPARPAWNGERRSAAYTPPVRRSVASGPPPPPRSQHGLPEGLRWSLTSFDATPEAPPSRRRRVVLGLRCGPRRGGDARHGLARCAARPSRRAGIGGRHLHGHHPRGRPGLDRSRPPRRSRQRLVREPALRDPHRGGPVAHHPPGPRRVLGRDRRRNEGHLHAPPGPRVQRRLPAARRRRRPQLAPPVHAAATPRRSPR